MLGGSRGGGMSVVKVWLLRGTLMLSEGWLIVIEGLLLRGCS